MIEALKLATAMIADGEGCVLRAYPDPIWKRIPRTEANYTAWGKPWTIGYGETLGIAEGMVWTHEKALAVFSQRVAYFMREVLKLCPQLFLEPPTRLAACVSLTYNIGVAGFAASRVRSLTRRAEYQLAADAFLLWNKAGGKVMRGLTLRRHRERKVYLG